MKAQDIQNQLDAERIEHNTERLENNAQIKARDAQIKVGYI
jgi:hypothetical protein